MRRTPCGKFFAPALFIQDGTKDRDHEVSEMRRAFIELKPADDTMIGQILSDSRFGDSKMFSETRFDGLRAPATGPASQKIRNSDTQGLASLHVIVAVEVGIGENKNARSDWSVIRIT